MYEEFVARSNDELILLFFPFFPQQDDGLNKPATLLEKYLIRCNSVNVKLTKVIWLPVVILCPFSKVI